MSLTNAVAAGPPAVPTRASSARAAGSPQFESTSSHSQQLPESLGFAALLEATVAAQTDAATEPSAALPADDATGASAPETVPLVTPDAAWGSWIPSAPGIEPETGGDVLAGVQDESGSESSIASGGAAANAAPLSDAPGVIPVTGDGGSSPTGVPVEPVAPAAAPAVPAGPAPGDPSLQQPGIGAPGAAGRPARAAGATPAAASVPEHPIAIETLPGDTRAATEPADGTQRSATAAPVPMAAPAAHGTSPGGPASAPAAPGATPDAALWVSPAAPSAADPTPASTQGRGAAPAVAPAADSRVSEASSPSAHAGAPPATSTGVEPAPTPADHSAPVVAQPAAVPAPPPVPGAPAAPVAPAASAAPVPPPLTTQIAPTLFTLAGVKPGEHVLTINVAPDTLGPVTVRAHVTVDSVRVELFAPTDAGREALRAILPDLRRDLAGSGLNANLDLSQENQASDHGEQAEGGPRSRPRAPDAQPASDPGVQRRPHSISSASTIDVLA